MPTRRRFLALASTVALAATVAPKAIAKPPVDIVIVPTEVFDVEKWVFVPLEGGLRNIKKGQIFRRVYEGQHVPNEISKEHVVDGELAWWGVADTDGYLALDANGKVEGGCEATFYETYQAWTDAGIEIAQAAA